MPSPPDSPPLPPPVPVETHPYRVGGSPSPLEQRALPDPTRLAPEDAYFAPSLLRARSAHADFDESLESLNDGAPDSVADLRSPPDARKGRVSPVSVVCWSSSGTALGWILWDSWAWKEHRDGSHAADAVEGDDGSSSSSMASSVNPSAAGSRSNVQKEGQVHGLGLTMSEPNEPLRGRADFNGDNGMLDPSPSATHTGTSHEARSLLLSSRNRQRLTTVKSAFLIYFALLGLSPILKSLTKSTASDSIWAMSCWLLIMNIFSFDYGSGEGAGATKFPASLSTNAAVMASTVLASRLPSTTHVFSLMLFSMEVFGLFPIFRRQLRHISWTGHVLLTLALVIAAGGAVGTTLRGGWAAAVVGSILGSILTALAMGGCSWWLISLQKYKNVVTGPWDPARPIIRRHWD
ncbi:hypothetical protein MW887_002742 [Aspergillus wentii]|nr:hypothetical protein MW887_002742 [Aspergillus wentii]